MIRVKICGITNIEDALFCAEQGADALGFVFYEKSPRFISPEDAGAIIRALPPFITPVGVFVNPVGIIVERLIKYSGVRVLQFHGSEGPEFCGGFGVPYIKAFRVRGPESLGGMQSYKDASAFLLDSFSEAEFGGTGRTFDWDAAIAARGHGRIILAGGLTPGNVSEAVRRVMPYAVDVSSGVESEKGRKDHAAVREFIAKVKEV